LSFLNLSQSTQRSQSNDITFGLIPLRGGIRLTISETFEEHPILAKFKESDNKGLCFWFLVKEKTRNNKPEARDQKPKTSINQAKRVYRNVTRK